MQCASLGPQRLHCFAFGGVAAAVYSEGMRSSSFGRLLRSGWGWGGGCAALAGVISLGAVELAPPFSDHMVLQAHQPVPIWGTAEPGQRVSVEFAGQSHATQADGEGRWRVELAPLDYAPDHAPQTLLVQGKRVLRVKDVLVGEVWLCAGQSNMRFTLGHKVEPRGANDPLLFPAELGAAAHGRIRLLNVSGGTPAGRKWAVCSPDTARDFSAIGYFFGQALLWARDVPVGLIDLGRGGASIRTFLPAEAIESRPEFARAFREETRPGYRNGGVFSAEVRWLAPFALRGVLWYQGESDVARAGIYPALLQTLLASWRETFAAPELPFLIVQLAPYERRRTDPPRARTGVGWAELRAAQAWVTEHVPHTALAVIADLGERLDIHPRAKQPVGERLAALARGVVYGEEIAAQAPRWRSSRVRGGEVELTFDRVGAGLELRSGGEGGFAVAIGGGEFQPVPGRVIPPDTVVLTLPAGKAGEVEVRYGWQDYFEPVLFSRDGLPAGPFRTDARPLTRGGAGD